MNRHDKLALAPGVTWSAGPTGVFLLDDRVLYLEDDTGALIQLMESLQCGINEESALSLCSRLDCDGELLVTLKRLGFVRISSKNRWVGTQYEKHVDYFATIGADGNAAQELIQSAHVAILGLGGIGSVLLQHLLAAGIQDYTLIDRDVIAESNLNRQFIYSRADVGRTKAEAARSFVLSANSQAQIHAIQADVDSLSALQAIDIRRPLDVLVLAADYPPCQIERISVGSVENFDA